MSSTNKTTYYELPQFVDSDLFNPLVDDNDAYDKIDTALHNIADAEAGDASEIVAVKGRVTTTEGKIEALETQNGVEVLTTTAQTLSGAVNELDGDVSSLDSRLDVVEDDINNENTGLKVKVASLGTRITTAEGDIDALEAQNGNETLTTTAQTLSGAVNELLEDIKGGFVTPEMFGAIGDGITDDAQAINDAIASGYNVLFNKDKTYLVKANVHDGYICGIYVDRKVTLNFNGSIIKVDKDNQTYCYGCYIVANGVKLITPHIDGGCASDAVSIDYSDSHGICVRGADNVTIINASIENCYGDGLYITNANNIKIIGDNFFKKIGRNGVSIIKADGAYIDSLYCEDIKYNAPYCAVDIEPNDYTQDIVNIYINKCVAINCVNGVGAVSVGGQLSANIKAIICKNCSGSCFSANYIISNDSGSQVHVNDDNKIIVDDVIAVNMKNTIIYLKNTNASKMPFISVKNVSAYNYTVDTSENVISYSDAFIYYLQATDVSGFDHHGNFEILNIHVDNADVLPLAIRDNVSGHPDNIDNVLVEFKSPVHNEISNNGTFKGVLSITPPPLDFGIIPAGESDSATYQALVNKLLSYSYGEYFIYGRIAGKGNIGSGVAKITENDSMGSNANLVSDNYWCSLRIYRGGTFRAYETVGNTVV